MSDPVSNHDIEDVLSSIRRLVAQGNSDSDRQTEEKAPVVRSVDREPRIDRLVLTPAFRVESTASDSPKTDLLQSPPQFATDDDDASDTEVFWTEEVAEPTVKHPETSDRASLEATIAELEAAVTQAPDEWEPDGSEILIESSVTSAFLHKLDARQIKSPEETVTDAVADQIADTIAEEITEKLQFEETQFSKADHDAANLETPPSFAPSEPEIVEEPPTDDEPRFSHTRHKEVYDPVAEATADAAETEGGDVYGDELLLDDVEIGPVGTPNGGQLVDPDALRALVGEMIREELQGEMGERITRNVRKLVRREINRVITEQDI